MKPHARLSTRLQNVRRSLATQWQAYHQQRQSPGFLRHFSPRFSQHFSQHFGRIRRGICWRRFLKHIVITIAAVGLIRAFAVDWNEVPTWSMAPTIMAGDRIVVNKLAYDLHVPGTGLSLIQWASPLRGDVVVFRSPETGVLMVKRVIGLPGDTVELRGGMIYVNGQRIEYQRIGKRGDWVHRYAESFGDETPHTVLYIPSRPLARYMAPVTVPDDQYFVMGDHRDDSYDSRNFGTVAQSAIRGRVSVIAASFDPDDGMAPRWKRFLLRL